MLPAIESAGAFLSIGGFLITVVVLTVMPRSNGAAARIECFCFEATRQDGLVMASSSVSECLMQLLLLAFQTFHRIWPKRSLGQPDFTDQY